MSKYLKISRVNFTPNKIYFAYFDINFRKFGNFCSMTLTLDLIGLKFCKLFYVLIKVVNTGMFKQYISKVSY